MFMHNSRGNKWQDEKDLSPGDARVVIIPNACGSNDFLATGAAIKGAARKFAIDYHALRRHWRNHVSAEARATYIAGPAAAKDQLEEIVADESLVQISEFPTGDFGSNRQAVSVETDRPFRSKAAPRCGWVLVPTLANRRCVIHPILLWSAKASTLVIIYSF